MLSSSVDRVDAVDNPEVASSGRNPAVRTLQEPPDIWDMVHETHTEFKPGSAFIGRLISSRVWLAAILLIIAGGAGSWYVVSRGSSVSKTSAPIAPAKSLEIKPLQSDPANTTVSSPQEQISTPTSINGSNAGTAASSQYAPANKTASADQPTNTLARPGTDQRAIEDLKSNGTARATSSRTPPSVKPRGQNPPNGGMFSEASLAGKEKQEGIKAPRSNTAKGEVVGLAGNKDGNQTSVPAGPKSDNQKSEGPAASKKEGDKAPPSAPAQTNSTPKAKVIPWP